MAKPKTTNGYNTEAAEAFVRRFENLNGELEKLKSEHMTKAKEVRSDQKEILQEAKAAGFEPKVIKAIVKKNEHERKIEELPDGFDIDEQSQYDALADAIGPLGAAAAAAHAKKKVGDAPNTAKPN